MISGTAAPRPAITDHRSARDSERTCCSRRRRAGQAADQADGSGDSQQLGGRAGAGLPENEGQSGHRTGQPSRRASAAAGPTRSARHPGQHAPADRGRHRQAQHRHGRPPAMAIDRPRFAYVAQPKVVQFGDTPSSRDRQCGQAMSVEGGDDVPATAAAASRHCHLRATRPLGQATGRRRARHRTARPATRHRKPEAGWHKRRRPGKPSAVPPAEGRSHRWPGAAGDRGRGTQNSTIVTPPSAR